MDLLRSIYPPIEERKHLPELYVPAAYAIYAFTILIPGKLTRVIMTFPVLILLAFSSPLYTSGSVSNDYGAGGAPFSLVLAFIDYNILSQLENDPPRYIGELEPKPNAVGVSDDDCTTLWQKVKWALRFTTIVRGVGWNMQVKGVPDHPTARATRSAFVLRTALYALRCWIYKLSSVFVIQFACTMQENADSALTRRLLDVVIGWGGGIWAFTGLSWVYSMAATFTVAVGLCEPWEWPPMFGPKSEGWSVRQMWSVVWHQLLRRIVQKPGVRLARVLGCKKGSLGSKYLQLYIAFTMSMIVHEWQIFNAVRQDVGEFRFFMSQPVVITIEDFVQWLWKKYRPSEPNETLDLTARAVGYVWTFAWFSYCLPPFTKGLKSVDILGTGFVDPQVMSYGTQLANAWLRKV